jgi:nitrate reductase NapE
LERPSLFRGFHPVDKLSEETLERFLILIVDAKPSFNSERSRMQTETLEAGKSKKRREVLTFLVLAVLIWPFIAVGVVSGWGFAVWMYYLFTGPPGPV